MSVQLTVRISLPVDARLRQTAAIRRKRLGEVVDEVLDGGLPGSADIVAQIADLAEDSRDAAE
jgi:hypothetical protein